MAEVQPMARLWFAVSVGEALAVGGATQRPDRGPLRDGGGQTKTQPPNLEATLPIYFSLTGARTSTYALQLTYNLTVLREEKHQLRCG